MVPVKPQALQDKLTWPFEVVKRKSDVTYLVNLWSTRNPFSFLHVNHLKPHFEKSKVTMLLATNDGVEKESLPLPDLLPAKEKDGYVEGVNLSQSLIPEQQRDCRQVITLMDTNETQGHAPPAAVILAGFPGLESFYHWVAVPFCATYVVAFLGNCTMIYIIAFESTLHEPMYLFLSMLSVTDLILASTILPNMLSILWFHAGEVTFDGCIIQAFFVHFHFLLESAILLSMALDRYVAICQPLRYTAILTNKVVGKIGIVCVTRSFVFVTPGIYFVKVLQYCGNNVIHHTYCENMVIAKLSCSDITPSSIYGLTAAFLSTGLDFMFIVISYVLILKAVFHLPSKDARLKALSTCAAHVCIILIFYILAFFSFFTHRFGKNIPPYIHILLANLYLVVPPMFNPVVYGVKTKAIRTRFHQLYAKKKNPITKTIVKASLKENSLYSKVD
ncbi:olfactory receptor 52D1-like [Pleurodeles waltl]|uniref:olfactory receptor 52D1-like n=1 Tax=Pleurodeles waltl TaxID=8319 RepID=UPI0037096A14